ncbi:MAG: hypothetical protein LBG27_09310 [Spirochaetaceae bacterium]|jgi:hypothetical protein|nr:hypothetical protein [Spirochaetaceae bacterium]
MRGTWITNAPEGYDYSGTLVIDRNTITITGYEADYWFPNDPRRPFKDSTKGVSLKGCSESGKIYINDFGWKEGIPCEYTEGASPDYTKLLRFRFGDRYETLRRTGA